MVKTLPSNAGGAGSIPGQGGKIPHAPRPKKPKHKTEAILEHIQYRLLKKWSTPNKSFKKMVNCMLRVFASEWSTLSTLMLK